MKLEQSFEVQAPIDSGLGRADRPRARRAVPARRRDHRRDDDGTYHGTFQVKLGPTTAAYRGTIEIERPTRARTGDAEGARDRQARPGRRERDDRQHAHRGRRRARRSRRSPTSRSPAGSRVRPRRDDQGHLQPADERLRDLPAGPAGRAAGRRGRDAGRAADRAAPRRPRRRTTCTPAAARAAASATAPPPPRRAAARPAAPPPAPAKPVNGLSLFFGVLWERIKRLFGRGNS